MSRALAVADTDAGIVNRPGYDRRRWYAGDLRPLEIGQHRPVVRRLDAILAEPAGLQQLLARLVDRAEE